MRGAFAQRGTAWAIALALQAMAASMAVGARAQNESQPDAVAAPDATTSKAKLPASTNRKDIDEELTNARLRAATGAKSLISLQTSFTYNGSSVNSPLSKDRPVLSPGTIEMDPAKVTGNVSAKYRVTDHDNLNLGVGVGWITPSYEGQRGQVENPYIEYGRVFKAGSIQNVFSLNGKKYTAPTAVDARRLDWEAEIAHTILTQVGSTRWQAGLSMAWAREFYSQTPKDGSVQDLIAAYPFAEYEFNPTFTFRTVYRGLTYFNTSDRSDVFTRDDPTQSTGIGITITRDLFLYPNVQWVWEDMRPEKTNVAMTAYFNL